MALGFFSKYGLIQFENEQNANMLQVHVLIDQEMFVGVTTLWRWNKSFKEMIRPYL